MNTHTILAPATTAMDSLRHEIDRVFDRMTTPALASSWPTTRFLNAMRPHPAINVIEDDTTLFFEAELPGVSPSELEVTVADSMLTITGTRTLETPTDATSIRRERTTERFERVMRIPSGVNTEDIDAKIEDGILIVSLPKTEGSRTRRVPVRAN